MRRGRVGGAQTDRGLARRDQIIRVAAKLFADKGYDHVSINDIGAAVGITGPAIYRYFPGKEDILVSIFQNLYQRGSDSVDEIKALELDSRLALGRMIDAQIDLAINDSDMVRIVDREGRQVPPDVGDALQTIARASLAYWIEIASEARPGLGDEAIRVTVHAVLALINSISLRRTSERANPEVEGRLREMALSCFATLPTTV